MEQLSFTNNRIKVANLPLVDAQVVCKDVLRKIARYALYKYSEKFKIIDFSDTILVEQKHRDYRQTIIDAGTTKVSQINAATTNAELLVIYDSFAPWLN